VAKRLFDRARKRPRSKGDARGTHDVNTEGCEVHYGPDRRFTGERYLSAGMRDLVDDWRVDSVRGSDVVSTTRMDDLHVLVTFRTHDTARAFVVAANMEPPVQGATAILVSQDVEAQRVSGAEVLVEACPTTRVPSNTFPERAVLRS
jgi:hypothetical protein